jgi:HK97 gp10 family phage protein
MITITMEVKGTRELQERLRRVADVLREQAIEDGLWAAASVIHSRAVNMAPHDTGYLKDNIKIEPPRNQSIRIISHAEYSIYQEYGPRPGGRRQWKFTPFMRPAFDEERDNAIAAFNEFAIRAIGEAWR